MCLCGHRQLWRPQMGGTKWNKGGTSEGTYGPVGWEFVFLRKFTSVGQKFPKWPHRIWNTMFKNVGPKLVFFFKSGPNHEKMWALCSTIITWSRKITKTVLAFKNRHGLDITRLGLPSTMCYNQQWSVVSLINKMVKINNQSLQASISLTNRIKITKKSKKFNIWIVSNIPVPNELPLSAYRHHPNNRI